MAVTDQARNQLYNTIREAFGDEAAATLMELLPPVGWSDVARQRDLDQLAARLDLRFEAIDQRFEAIDQRFEAIDQRFDSLDQRFATRDDLREQTNRFIGWMLAGNASLVATVTLIVTLVVTLR